MKIIFSGRKYYLLTEVKLMKSQLTLESCFLGPTNGQGGEVRFKWIKIFCSTRLSKGIESRYLPFENRQTKFIKFFFHILTVFLSCYATYEKWRRSFWILKILWNQKSFIDFSFFVNNLLTFISQMGNPLGVYETN